MDTPFLLHDPQFSTAGPSQPASPSSKQSELSNEPRTDRCHIVTSPLILLHFDQRFHVVTRSRSSADTEGISYYFHVIAMFQSMQNAYYFVNKYDEMGVELNPIYGIFIRRNTVYAKGAAQPLKFFWTILNRGSERLKFQQTAFEFDCKSMQVRFEYPPSLQDVPPSTQQSTTRETASEIHQASNDAEISSIFDYEEIAHSRSSVDDTTLDFLARISLARNSGGFNVDRRNLELEIKHTSQGSLPNYMDESTKSNSTTEKNTINEPSRVGSWSASNVSDPLPLQEFMDMTISTSNEHSGRVDTGVSNTLKEVVNTTYSSEDYMREGIKRAMADETSIFLACKSPRPTSGGVNSAGKGAHVHGNGESSRKTDGSDQMTDETFVRGIWDDVPSLGS